MKIQNWGQKTDEATTEVALIAEDGGEERFLRSLVERSFAKYANPEFSPEAKDHIEVSVIICRQQPE